MQNAGNGFCVKPAKVGVRVRRGSVRLLWPECGNTDESEKERHIMLRISSAVEIKVRNMLQAYSRQGVLNQRPKAAYRWISHMEQGKVWGGSVSGRRRISRINPC